MNKQYTCYDLIKCCALALICSVQINQLQSQEFEYAIVDDWVNITRYNGNGGDVVIPSMIDGLPVRTVGYEVMGVMENCTSIVSLIIPEGIVHVGHWAFKGCTNLEQVTLPDSLTSIGQGAFIDCTNLTSINLPDALDTIPHHAFVNCKNLKSIEIPDSVKAIKMEAFKDCSSLAEVEIPYGITVIEHETFRGCSSLKTVTIPDSVTRIRDRAFHGCTALNKLILGNGLMVIERAFVFCESLETVEIPESLISIYEYAFEGCTRLTSFLVDPANPAYTSVDGVLLNKDQTELLYYPCGKTGAYSIPTTVNNIKNGAFIDCVGLTSLSINETVTSEWLDFPGCLNLKEINVSQGNPYYSSIDGVLFDKDQKTLLWYPQAREGEYTVPKNIDVVKVYFGGGAFVDCQNLTKITLPAGIVEIPWRTFSNCPQLTEIWVSEDNPVFSSIDGVLFNKNKTHLVLCPEGRTGAYDIPNGVKFLGAPNTYPWFGIFIPYDIPFHTPAFAKCHNLTSITVPDSVIEIGEGDFNNCPNLTGLYFEGDAPRIRDYPYMYSYEVRAWLGGSILEGSNSVTVYYQEGTEGWSDSFFDRPTDTWNSSPPYRVVGHFANTDTLLGWLMVDHAPWIWCESVSCWFNLPDETVTAGKGWVFPPEQDNLHIIQIDGTDLGYSFTLSKWLYLTDSGWMYMM